MNPVSTQATPLAALIHFSQRDPLPTMEGSAPAPCALVCWPLFAPAQGQCGATCFHMEGSKAQEDLESSGEDGRRCSRRRVVGWWQRVAGHLILCQWRDGFKWYDLQEQNKKMSLPSLKLPTALCKICLFPPWVYVMIYWNSRLEVSPDTIFKRCIQHLSQDYLHFPNKLVNYFQY